MGRGRRMQILNQRRDLKSIKSLEKIALEQLISVEEETVFDPMNSSDEDFIKKTSVLSNSQAAELFIKRNAFECKHDCQSGNSQFFKDFNDKPKAYISAFFLLIKKQKARCFWCEKFPKEKITLVGKKKKKKKLLYSFGVDFIRDCSQGGALFELKGAEGNNCVLACKDCLRKRYSAETNHDSIADWLDYGLKNKIISQEKAKNTYLDLQNLNLCRDWQAFIKTKQKAIGQERLRQEQRRKRKILDKAKKFGLSIESSTPPMNDRKKKKIRNRFFEDGHDFCAWCQKKLTLQNITLDHIQTCFHGGSHWYGNILPACKKCNNRRGHKTVEDFLFDAPKPCLELIESRLKLTESSPKTFHAYWLIENHTVYMNYNKETQEYKFLDLRE